MPKGCLSTMHRRTCGSTLDALGGNAHAAKHKDILAEQTTEGQIVKAQRGVTVRSAIGRTTAHLRALTSVQDMGSI